VTSRRQESPRTSRSGSKVLAACRRAISTASRLSPIRAALHEGLSGLKRTLAELPKQKSLATFLLANMIYSDGLVSLFAFGGIYAAGTFGWQTIQIGSFGILLAIAGTFGAWLGGKLDDRLGPKRVIVGSLLILLFALSAILLVDKDSILFMKVAPPVPGGPLFSGAAERAYLLLGCLIGAAGGPLQAAGRSLRHWKRIECFNLRRLSWASVPAWTSQRICTC